MPASRCSLSATRDIKKSRWVEVWGVYFLHTAALG